MYNTKIESLGIYLPNRVQTTSDLMAGCNKRPRWDLERLTGIKERRVAEEEFSIDLAVKAVQKALAMSKYSIQDIDMVICTSISKYERELELVYEPATSIELVRRLGADKALNFDVVNACAGMFTGLYILDSFIRCGTVRCGIVVSGERITPLAKNAQQEIRHSFDGQLASLTLGDCGAAIILEGNENPDVGFQHMQFVTGAKHSDLCIGGPSRRGSGPSMYTKPVRLHRRGLENFMPYFKETVDRSNWTMSDLDYIIPHQTSVRAIKKVMRKIKEFAKLELDDNILINVEKYGNTSSTTHSLVLHEYILQNIIQPKQKLIFMIGASGIVLGNATYVMDDLPQRYKAHYEEEKHEEKSA